MNEEKKEDEDEEDEESGEEKNEDDVEEEEVELGELLEKAKFESQPGCCEEDVEEEDAVIEEEEEENDEDVVDGEEEDEEVAVKQVGWPVLDMARMLLLVGRWLGKIITGSWVQCHKCPFLPGLKLSFVAVLDKL